MARNTAIALVLGIISMLGGFSVFANDALINFSRANAQIDATFREGVYTVSCVSRRGNPYDGDTVELRYSRGNLFWIETARLEHIDTPEIRSPRRAEAEAARDRLSELLGCNTFQLETFTATVSGDDLYGRALTDLDAVQTLLDEGLGVPYEGGQRGG